MSYKIPTFQDRIDSAADAKKRALDKLRAKPPVDEKILAERKAQRLQRDTVRAERAAEKKAAELARREAEAAAKAAVPQPLTEAEKKAARDARYAARKNRR